MAAKLTNQSELENLIENIPFSVKINFDYLTIWDKLETDISNIKFVLKQSNANADDKYLAKDKTSQNADFTISGTEFTIDVKITDLTNLKPGTYSPRLGILFTGETQFRDCGEIQFGKITIQKSWFDVIVLQPPL